MNIGGSAKGALTAGLLVLTVATGIATAQSFPGKIDEKLIGDWDCDGTRTYITRWGSIELLGDGYAAGLYHAMDGLFAIKWDEGEREDWSYGFDGPAVVFTPPDGEKKRCTLR